MYFADLARQRIAAIHRNRLTLGEIAAAYEAVAAMYARDERALLALQAVTGLAVEHADAIVARWSARRLVSYAEAAAGLTHYVIANGVLPAAAREERT